jgi:hypothetical protein
MGFICPSVGKEVTMFIRNLRLSLVACFCVVLSANLCMAKDYKIGTEFRDIFRTDFSAGQHNVPLPPGTWKLVAQNDRLAGGGVTHVAMKRYYLIRHSNSRVTGTLYVFLNKDTPDWGWNISNICSDKRRQRSWYFYDDSYDGHEDCNIVYPFRRFHLNRRNTKFFPEAFDYIDSRNLVIPRTWIGVRFGRSDGGNFLQVNYHFPPDHYGLSNASSPGNFSDYRIQRFPENVAFKKNIAAWSKSWKELIDKGFKDKLRKEEVTAHPQIAKASPGDRAGQDGFSNMSEFRLGAFLNSEQMKKLYSGAEFESHNTAGDTARARYNADGTYRVVINGRTMTGKWWVRQSGEYCFENDNGGTGCWLTKYLGGKNFQNLNAQGRTRVQTLIGKLGKQISTKSVAALNSDIAVRSPTSSENKQKPAGATVTAAVRPQDETMKTIKRREEYLSREQIKKSFVSRTFETTTRNGSTRSIVFRADGNLLGNREGGAGAHSEDFGEWSVDQGDRLCTKWDNWYYSSKECFRVKKRGKRLVLYNSHSRPIRSFEDVSPPSPVSHAATTKSVASVSGSVPDGELSAAQIKKLLNDKALARSESTIIWGREYDHSQDEDCLVTHNFYSGGKIKTTCSSSLGSDDEIGSWSVDENNRLCMKWPTWFEGKKWCSRVKKSGKKISLINSNRSSENYSIEKH